MYLLESPPGIIGDRIIWGHRIINGRVIVSKQYWWHRFIHKGFKDITPPGWGRSYAKLGIIKNVLHIHHCAFGDMLFLTPIFEAYARKYPGVIQTVETNKKGALILEGNPSVSHIRISKSGTIPRDVDKFDDVINYDGMLSRYPGSELVNVYDLASEWAGVELSDHDKKPIMYFGDHEKRSVEELLLSLDIREAEPYIMLQYDTSSKIRNIAPQVFTDLAEKLAREGYKVLLFGGGNLGKKVLWICESCGRRNYIRLPDRMNHLHVLCPCGKERTLQRKSGETPGIHFLDSDRVTIRTLALLISKASAFIGPDSSGLHLAACFDRPALGIFFSFDGDLRMRYYRNSRCMQIEVPCGPCFQYGTGPCRNHTSQGYPLCVKHVTADEIFEEFKKLVKGPSLPITVPFRPAQARPCPVCLSEERKYLCRKKMVCYYECIDCSVIYRDIEVKEPSVRICRPYDVFQLKQEERSQRELASILHKRFFKPGAVVLEVGCETLYALDELKKRGWDAYGLDISGALGAELSEKFSRMTGVITRCAFQSFKAEMKFTLVWMNKAFERFHEPREVFQWVYNLLKEDGIFALQVHDGDQWRMSLLKPRWKGVNTSYAGEYSVLPNERSLRFLAELTGFHYIGREPVHDPDCMFIKFHKSDTFRAPSHS